MWLVIRVKKNNINFLKDELKKKFKTTFNFYSPKILIEEFKNKKLVKKEVKIMGDYIFCFSRIFENRMVLNQLKFVRGIIDYLNGCDLAQKEILNFINKIKSSEDKKGYVKLNIFDAEVNKYYKFLNGPFAKKIFKIKSIQRNMIEILLGKIHTFIDKRKLLFSPV